MSTARDDLDQRYDFGDDDPTPAPASDPAFDPAFDGWLRASVRSLNEPGAPPTDAMWAVIATAQDASRAAAEGRIAGVIPLRRRGWVLPATLAAALLLGVALDRVLVMRSAGTAVAPLATRSPTAIAPSAASPSVVDARARTDLYRLAAVQTLTQAEALLTAYRAGGGGIRADSATRQLGGWARDVLGSTRLLLDSPAGADPQLRPLLNDIELVLVQIVRLSGTPLDSADRALIDHALRDRDLLPRIRTAVPAGAADAAIASDD